MCDDLRVRNVRSASVGFYLVCFSLALHLQILLVMLRYYLKLESLQNGSWYGFDMEWLLHVIHTQSAFRYSKLTIETLEQGVKYVQS